MSISINVECMKKCDIMIDAMYWISNVGPEHYCHSQIPTVSAKLKNSMSMKIYMCMKMWINKTKVIL